MKKCKFCHRLLVENQKTFCSALCYQSDIQMNLMMLNEINNVHSPSVLSGPSGGGKLSSGVPFSTEYQGIYDEFVVAPSVADALAQDTFVSTLVDGEVWSELDRMFIPASHASGRDSLLDWLHPAIEANVATIVNAPTHTLKQGYKGNTTSMYINSNFDLSTATKFHYAVSGGNAGASMGFYIRDDVLVVNDRDIGVDTLTGSDWSHFFQTGIDHRVQIHGNGAISNAVSKQKGLTTINASGDQTFPSYSAEIFTDGTLLLEQPGIMTADADGEVYISAANYNGSPFGFSQRQMSMAFIGDYLNAAKQLILYNAFQTLMTHYGTQV